jgi:hypothetical protein
MPLPGSKRDKAIKAQFLQEIVEPKVQVEEKAEELQEILEPEVQVEEKAEELQEIIEQPVNVPPQPEKEEENALINEQPLADHQKTKPQNKKRGIVSRIFKSGGEF